MALRWRLLDDLTPDDRRRVLGRMHRRSHGAGEVIFHEGDPADTIFFIVEGRVVARRFTVNGDRLIYGVFGPGEAFGEVAMWTPDHRRTATIQALEPVVTMSLRYVDFQQLCAEHPRVERLLVRCLADRVSRLTEGLMEALHVPADQRVARRIVDLCDVYAPSGGPLGPIRVPLTQSDLAELCGVTRPTANRVLRRLAATTAITLTRGVVSVNDLTVVRHAAGAAYRPPHGVHPD